MSGEYRVDLHVKVLSAAVVERAKRAGLDALVYAPHFTSLPTIEADAQRYADDDLAIIPARELFTGAWGNRRHVLALDLEDPVPDFLTLSATMAELERQDAVVLVPHPEFATVSLGSAECRHYRELIDAVEVFNPKHLPHHNRRARALAAEVDLPLFASSYAHLPRTVGAAWTVFEGLNGSVDPREAPAEALFDALRRGTPRRVERLTGLGRWNRSMPEMGHLVWENSWQKARRVLGGETEATHPTDPVYEGRFDEESVY